MFGCAFSTNRRIALDDPNVGFAFLPPAMSLSRTIVGYAVEGCDETGDCSTGIGGIDLRDTNPATQNVQGYSADPKTKGLVKVGSLRMKRNGSVAWIVCPERAEGSEVIGARRPNCVKKGDLDRVYKLEGFAGKVTLLDHGYGIDPSSLHLSGSRITWLHSGHRRHATLH